MKTIHHWSRQHPHCNQIKVSPSYFSLQLCISSRKCSLFWKISHISWPITVNKIKNCLEQWLNESSSFMSDTSEKNIMEESVKQLSATPLNSVSQCQTQQWTCIYTRHKKKLWITHVLALRLHKQQSPSIGLWHPSSNHCHNWLHKQQTPSTGLRHPSSNHCHNWLHKLQTPSTGLWHPSSNHCHNWLHKLQTPSIGLWHPSPNHCHNFLHKLQTPRTGLWHPTSNHCHNWLQCNQFQRSQKTITYLVVFL